MCVSVFVFTQRELCAWLQETNYLDLSDLPLTSTTEFFSYAAFFMNYHFCGLGNHYYLIPLICNETLHVYINFENIRNKSDNVRIT